MYIYTVFYIDTKELYCTCCFIMCFFPLNISQFSIQSSLDSNNINQLVYILTFNLSRVFYKHQAVKVRVPSLMELSHNNCVWCWKNPGIQVPREPRWECVYWFNSLASNSSLRLILPLAPQSQHKHQLLLLNFHVHFSFQPCILNAEIYN